MLIAEKILGTGNFKIAEAHRKPEDTVILPLDMLDPIDKVREPAFYHFVKKTFITNKEKLLYPLIIHPITVEDWWKEKELDKDQLPPPEDSHLLRYRIQCGCNRYFMLKELEYDAVECVVAYKKEDAWELCKKTRIDKSWQRGVYNV